MLKTIALENKQITVEKLLDIFLYIIYEQPQVEQLRLAAIDSIEYLKNSSLDYSDLLAHVNERYSRLLVL
jgi:hypothetical protein